MIIIDIGCGRKKIAGSIGIDSSKMSSADIFIDLNRDALPFEDDSVDFAYSSHTLEHLTKDGFFNVMREVYRVLKPGAQFNVLVPYFSVQANWANPFHNNDLCFNEHTFRFFSSDYETSALDQVEYASPSVPQWGLRYSANFELGMEFRTSRIKFFYFPHARDLPEPERRALRAKQSDVVEQISYWLDVIKPCPIRPETGPTSSGVDPFAFVQEQRAFLKDQIDYLSKRSTRPADYEAIKLLNQQIEQAGSLYKIGSNFIPADQLVFELDEAIQYLRRHIDKQ